MLGVFRKYYQPGALFISTFTIASIFSALGVDPHHHGIMFKPAFDVAHGHMLFRDTFTQYGALTTLLQAWALQLFGDYLLVIQIQTAFFYGLISLCLYYIWLKILPRWLTIISVVIWLLLAPYYRTLMPFVPWSSVPALLFQMLSLLLVLDALSKKSHIIMMLAGGLAVLTFWCRQPVGVFHCASLFFFLTTIPLITGQSWKEAMIDCAFFVTGVIVASLPFFAWLTLNGALTDMYLQSIKAAIFFGTTTYQTESYSLFVNILMALLAYEEKISHFYTPWSILPLICLCLLFILVVKRWRDRDSIKSHLPLYGLLLVSVASWMQYYPVPCLRHLYWAATPMIGVFSYGVWKLCEWLFAKQKKLQVIIICIVLTFIFKDQIDAGIFNGSIKLSILKTKIEAPMVLRGMYTTSVSAVKYKEIDRSFRDAIMKNSYLLNLTSDALYLTFIGPQKNFHPMYIDWGKYNDFIYPDFQKQRSAFIKGAKPLLLSIEGEDIPDWNCIEVFDMVTERKRSFGYGQSHKLALYGFPGSSNTYGCYDISTAEGNLMNKQYY